MVLQLFIVCSHRESFKGIVSTVSQIQSFEVVVKYVYLLEMGIRCCCLYPSPLFGPSHPKCEHELTIKSFNIVIATGWSQTEPCFPGAILSRRWMSLPNIWQWKAPVDSLLHPTKTLGFDEMKLALVLLRAALTSQQQCLQPVLPQEMLHQHWASLAWTPLNIFILCHSQSSKTLRIAPEEEM